MYLELQKHIYSKALVQVKARKKTSSFCGITRADNLVYNNMRYT